MPSWKGRILPFLLVPIPAAFRRLLRSLKKRSFCNGLMSPLFVQLLLPYCVICLLSLLLQVAGNPAAPVFITIFAGCRTGMGTKCLIW